MSTLALRSRDNKKLSIVITGILILITFGAVNGVKACNLVWWTIRLMARISGTPAFSVITIAKIPRRAWAGHK